MTDYIPGRIYSGVYCGGKREIFIWSGDHLQFVGKQKSVDAGNLTDVRGPLVVLDLDNLPLAPRDIAVELRTMQYDSLDSIADQIEEQTRPPLQVGWHEVISNYGAASVLRWDGSAWWFSGNKPVGTAHTDKWTSTHFIGPASDAS